MGREWTENKACVVYVTSFKNAMDYCEWSYLENLDVFLDRVDLEEKGDLFWSQQ